MRHPDRKTVFFIFAAAVLLFICVQNLISARIGFIGYTETAFYLQDFAYHIILADRFWFKGFGNLYDLNFQLQALSAYMGRPAMVTMPVGVTPLAFIVWMPFAWIAGYGLSLAYSLWITVSMGVLVLALWKVLAFLSPVRSFQVLPLVLIGICIFSLVGVSTVVVGQTSIFAAGILSLLFYRLVSHADDPGGRPVDWPTVVLVLLGAMKPPYMIIGFVSLLIYGRWRDLVWTTGILLLLLAAMTPLMTTDWPGAYRHLLGMYAGGNFPDIYDWAVVPRTMNIFRSAISGETGDRTAVMASSIISILVITGIAVFSLFRDRLAPGLRPKLAVGLVACCLLFGPYLGAYEDLLLIPVFIIVLLSGETPPVAGFQGIGLCAALFLSLLHGLPAFPHPGVFFLLKALVLTGMIRYAGRREQRSPDTCTGH